jgi:hypothetical protein
MPIKINWAWWHRPIIPITPEVEEGGLQIGGQLSNLSQNKLFKKA